MRLILLILAIFALGACPRHPATNSGKPGPGSLAHPDALEALFRHQFEHNASGGQQAVAAYCLEVDGKDSPAAFLARFSAVRPSVKPASACEYRGPAVVEKATGSKALVHFVRDLRCDSTRCTATGGYGEANLSASTNAYGLEEKAGHWVVTSDVIECIS